MLERKEFPVHRPGPVSLKLFGHPMQFRGRMIEYTIVPVNPRSAGIWLTEDLDLSIGKRFIMENYYRKDLEAAINDVRAACREALAGRFEETLWRDGKGTIVSSVSRFPNLKWSPMHHVSGFGRLFKKTTEDHVLYEPYVPPSR